MQKRAIYLLNCLHKWEKKSSFALGKGTQLAEARLSYRKVPLHLDLQNYINNNQKITIMSEIESKVKAIIVDKLGVDEAEVVATASFTNDLGADSLDTVELIMEFEKEFGINIPDDQAEKITTVGDAISYIEANAK